MKKYLVLLPLLSLFLFASAEVETGAPHQPQALPSDWLTQEEHAENHVKIKEHETDTFQTKFLNMLVILGLLIGFMILASWALKKMMRNRVEILNTSSNIKLVETRHLSPRCTLYLVDIEGQGFLVAESPTTVTHLATFEIPKAATVKE